MKPAHPAGSCLSHRITASNTCTHMFALLFLCHFVTATGLKCYQPFILYASFCVNKITETVEVIRTDGSIKIYDFCNWECEAKSLNVF